MPVAAVVRTEAPSLSTANKGMESTEVAEIIVSGLLLQLLEYFGVKWNQTQLDDCAQLWATEYHWMTMAEIKHFFVKCKTGFYSKEDFRHLSPFQLMGWLGTYADELLVERGKYGEERAMLERKAKEAARDNNPNLIDVDFNVLRELLRPHPISEEDQAHADEELQQRRDGILRDFAEKNNVSLDEVRKSLESK